MKVVLPKITSRTPAERSADMNRALIRNEGKIGGQLFGPIPAGHRREFFCLDEHTWVWHEEYMQNNRRKVVTTYYSVRPGSVLKSVDGHAYYRLSRTEARNFFSATDLYRQRIANDYQQLLQAA